MDKNLPSPPVIGENGATLIFPTPDPDLYPYAAGETLSSCPTATATGSSSRNTAPPVSVGAAQLAAAVISAVSALVSGPSP